jgi:hypothetical protein
MRILLPLALSLVIAAPAAAQTRDRSDAVRPAARAHAQPAPPVHAPFYRGPVAGPLCIPWCPADRNPCDPPEFKIADARCGPDD